MIFRFLSLAAVFVLSSCAYTMEKSYQDIKIETPGAENALCYIDVDKLRYRVHPPETLSITKSKADLHVDCLAPGNRRKKVIIEPRFSRYGYADMALGVIPGLAWDAASNSLYKYPDIVTVDFTYAAIKPEDMPAQNRPDVKPPEEYTLEEILPGEPRMNKDKGALPVEFKKREKPGMVQGDGPVEYMIQSGAAPDKGALKPASRAVINPGGAPSQPAGPVLTGPSYPGE